MQITTRETFKAAFPFVDAALDSYAYRQSSEIRRSRFLALMTEYAARPSVSKVAMIEARRSLYSLFDLAGDVIESELLQAKRDVTLPATVKLQIDDLYFSNFNESHRAGANIKRAEKLPESLPVRARALAFLADVAKGGELLEALRNGKAARQAA